MRQQGIQRFWRRFNWFERGLWISSAAVILISFFAAGNTRWFYLLTSLLGATALIFVSKGDVTGQILTVVFSVFYGIISFSYHYYGEMITYLGMTLPIAMASVITWLRHPYRGQRTEVQVNRLHPVEYVWILLLGSGITWGFYFILKALHTGNLFWSTLSVFTSFAAVFLSMRRSAFYALAYAANDVVLIVLWSMASQGDPEYLSMVICFVAFLANDLYGFFNWLRMGRRQKADGRE